MNPQEMLIKKIHTALPKIKEWMNNVLDAQQNNATPVIKYNFPKLQKIFPSAFLEKSKVVYLEGKVPFPPLSQIGLHELAGMDQRTMGGVTYKDTFFVNNLNRTESLHFHELIHVIQWETLGVDNFLLAYGVGLMQCSKIWGQTPTIDCEKRKNSALNFKNATT